MNIRFVMLGIIIFLVIGAFILGDFSQNAIRDTVEQTDYLESTTKIELSNDDNETITMMSSGAIIEYTYEDLTGGTPIRSS